MACKDFALLVQADFDGELNAAEAASLENHRAGCADCDATYRQLSHLRTALRERVTYHRMPDALRRTLEIRLAGSIQPSPAAPSPARWIALQPPRHAARWWHSALGFGAGVALATMLTLVVVPSQQDGASEIVASHIRALQPGHLLDIESNDQHNVKPWFDGRVAFSPPVKNLAGQGFPLVGGRLDYVDGHLAAVLVYKRAQHAIDVFMWPAQESGGSKQSFTEHNGYNTYHWVHDGLNVWVISDLNTAELGDFIDRLKAPS